MKILAFLLLPILVSGCVKPADADPKARFARAFSAGCEETYVKANFLTKRDAHALCKCVADDLAKKNDLAELETLFASSPDGKLSKLAEEKAAMSTYLCIDIVEKANSSK